MRIKRVRLEHHRKSALRGRDVVDTRAVDEKIALGHRFQPGDHAKQRRLAATRRADEDNKFAVLDFEINAMDNGGRAVALDDPMQLE